VHVVDRRPGEILLISKADSRTFLGDIAVFTGEPTISACIAAKPPDVNAFERHQLRAMLAGWPPFAETVLGTLTARRALARARGARGAASDRPPRVSAGLPGAQSAGAQPPARPQLRRRRPIRRARRFSTRWASGPRRRPVLVRNDGVLRNPSAPRWPATSVCARRWTASASTCSPSAAGPRGSPRPWPAARRGCGRSWPRPGTWRSGRGELVHRELPRLPHRCLRRRADPQGDPPGPPLDAVLSSFHPAVDLAHGPEG